MDGGILCERIESLDDQRLDIYRSLKTLNAARDARLFVAEGTTVVERLVRSDFELRSILISDRKWQTFADRLPPGIPVYRLTHELAQQLVGFSFHCGVVACAVRRPPLTLQQFCQHLNQTTDPVLLLVGDRVVDPENVGSLIRIASAFGARAVLLGPGCADPFSRRVLRVSMGNVLFLPVVEVQDLSAALTVLQRDARIQVCATALRADAVPLQQTEFSSRTALLLGNEYDGISDECLQNAAQCVIIPMDNETDSLNVSVAAAVCAYEYRRQHR
ncbi:MAG: RNA methyltransferase [Planctomycetaceae bacterium]|nr:RNA methyltransferase [Planctomycetaceae bacterium]